MNLVLVLVLFWLLLAALVMSECGSAVMFNFGDSNSDTGGRMAGLGTNVPPPHGRLFHQRSGRLCDGHLIVDSLTIYNDGGKNFWVHNTGPFGCLPDSLSVWKDDADLDPYGYLATINNGAKELNSRLGAVCDELSSELKNATVFMLILDIYSIKYDIVANYSKYGFKSPVKACCGYGGRPYNFNSSRRCGSPGCQVCPVGSLYTVGMEFATQRLLTLCVLPKFFLLNVRSPVSSLTLSAVPESSSK